MKKGFAAFMPPGVKCGICSLLLSMLCSVAGHAQRQAIGSFPEMDGGFEGQSFITAVATATVTGPKAAFTVNNANAVFTLVSNPANARSGSKYTTLTVSGNSANGVFSPTTAATITDGDAYVIQFFYKAGAITNKTFSGALSSQGSANLGTGITSPAMDQTSWTKSSVMVTAGGNAPGTDGLFFFKYNSTTASAYSFDDLVVYAGTGLDVTAPDEPTGAGCALGSGTSLLVNWTAPAGGVDGGGYIVVRGTSDPVTAPNANGIYGVGNSLGTGTVAYAGTDLYFEDTGLTPGVTYYYRVYAADKAFNYSAAATCTGVPTPPGYPFVITAGISAITLISAAGSGEVTSDGGDAVTEYGLVWSTSPYPVLPSATFTNDGAGIGIFASALTSLSPATAYYVRAYATNNTGTNYGNQVSFTTLDIPTVSTAVISGIGGVSATGGGNVLSEGGTPVIERGICWSASPNPSVADTRIIDGTPGPGSFTSIITGLGGGNTYYVRAYATSAIGTGYGAEVSFTTLTAYFNKPGTDVSQQGNWGNQPDGSGTPPTNFSADNLVFLLYNASATLGAPLALIGNGSRIIIGDGNTPAFFTIPVGFAFTGTVDVSSTGTLNIQNAINPTLGLLSTGSTVNFDGAAALSIPAANYYNLGSTNDAGGARVFANSTIGIAGTFTPGNAAYTTSGSTISFNGTSAQLIPAFTFRRLLTDNAAGCTTNGDVSVDSVLTVNENLAIADVDSFTMLVGSKVSVTGGKKLVVRGILSNKSAATAYNSFTGMEVEDGGWYKLAVNNGILPQTGIFKPGSTFLIDNVSPNNSKGLSSRLPDKDFDGNVIWNCSCLPAEDPYTEGDAHHLLDDDPDAFSTTGDFTLLHGNVRIGSGTDDRVFIVNNLNILGGDFRMMDNSSEGDADMIMYVNGDLTVNTTEGGLSLNSRGAGAEEYPDGDGKDTIYLKGNLIHTNGFIRTKFDAETVGLLVFNGTNGPQTAITPGFTDSVNVKIDNAAGVILSSGILNPNVLTFTNGKVTAQNATLVYPYHPMKGANSSRYVITEGTGALKYRTVVNADTTFYVGISDVSYNPVILNNAGVDDEFSVNLKPVFYNPPFDPTHVVNVEYNIEEDVAGGSDVKISLQWNATGFNNEASAFTRTSNVVIAHWLGTYWDEIPVAPPVEANSPYTVFTTNITSFSPFGIGNPCSFVECPILPLQQLSFSGKENAGIVNLFWKSIREQHLASYEVERSIDSRHFSGIGSIAAKNGSGDNYYAMDDNKAPGGVVYYRLRIVDRDGKYNYSNVVVINMKKQRQLQLYPNPVTTKLIITHNKAAKDATVCVYAHNGARMSVVNVSTGAETTAVNTAGLAAGIYLLRYENNGVVQTERFMKR